MNENWKRKAHDSAILCKTFIEKEGEEVLFEVAVANIWTNPNIDLDELAHVALKEKSQEKVKKYYFTGSHFEPMFD